MRSFSQMVGSPSAALGAALLVVLASAADGATTRVGLEFQINTYTPTFQERPAVAIEADGDFVVVWDSELEDGSDRGVFAQRFSSSGAPIAIEFQVNTYTVSFQRTAAVATDADGDFVVAWESYGQDGSNRGLFARRFSSAGTSLASEFQVSVATASSQESVAMAMETNGDFVVVWDGNNDGFGYGIAARRFSSDGTALGGEFNVNSYTLYQQLAPDIAMDADGDFVIVWHSGAPDPADYVIFGKRYSSSGSALGAEFQVNSYSFQPGPPLVFPDVAADLDGDFVVVWTGVGLDGSANGVFARRFSSSGASTGGDFQVNAYTPASQREPAIAMEADGEFVVAWVSTDGQDGSAEGIFARRFSPSGVGSDELQVNSTTSSLQDTPAVAINSDGDLVATWESLHEGGGKGIFGQRFASAGAFLDADGDGETDALTDGLLILRWLFGFSGTTLVTGAVDVAHCSRCTATEIADYLTSIALELDIDRDTETDALTDGLLVLRWLFGFTGATLVTGAVDLTNCTRCTAVQIEPYIATLL